MGSNEAIKKYKTALEAALSAQYTEHDVTVFKWIEDDFKLPAIVVNPPLFEPAEGVPITKDKFTITLKNSVYVCYSAADEGNDLECLQFSADLSNFINLNTWGLNPLGLRITPAKVTEVEPTIIEGLDNFTIQRIDFEQNLVITNT